MYTWRTAVVMKRIPISRKHLARPRWPLAGARFKGLYRECAEGLTWPRLSHPTSPDGWRQIETLYLEASAVALSERASFLDNACAGQPSLRSEVESLLEADLARGDFLEFPPSRLAADLLRKHPDGPESIGHDWFPLLESKYRAVDFPCRARAPARRGRSAGPACQ